MPRTWYLDASIGLRIVLGHSVKATKWYERRQAAGDQLVSSALLKLEMVRVLRRELFDYKDAIAFAAELVLLRIDNAILKVAAGIGPHVKSLDAIHLASAQRVGAGLTTIATHDAKMAAVARTLGFDVFDPVACAAVTKPHRS